MRYMGNNYGGGVPEASIKSWDSAFSMVTMLRPGESGARIPVGTRGVLYIKV